MLLNKFNPGLALIGLEQLGPDVLHLHPLNQYTKLPHNYPVKASKYYIIC